MEYLHLYAPPPPVAPKPKPKPTPESPARKVDFKWDEDMTVPSSQNLKRINYLFKKEKSLTDPYYDLHADIDNAELKIFLNMLFAPFKDDQNEIITKYHVLDALKTISGIDNLKDEFSVLEGILKDRLIEFPAHAAAGAAT